MRKRQVLRISGERLRASPMPVDHFAVNAQTEKCSSLKNIKCLHSDPSFLKYKQLSIITCSDCYGQTFHCILEREGRL